MACSSGHATGWLTGAILGDGEGPFVPEDRSIVVGPIDQGSRRGSTW